jgi:hypothetical protein
MDSRPSIPAPPQDQKATEEALTKLLREATAISTCTSCRTVARGNGESTTCGG